MGYLKADLSYFKYKDTQIAFRVWMDEFAKNQHEKLIIKYYDTPKNILSDYKKGKLRSCSLNTIYYLKNMQLYDSLTKEFWTIQKGNKIASRLVLLVRKNSGIKNIKDLKGKVISRQNDNILGKIFLEKEIMSSVRSNVKGYIDHYILTKKDSTSLLKTFFGKSDACIVPEYTLRIVSELNPAVEKRLLVLKKSKYIYFPALMLLYKNISPSMMKKFEKSVLLLNNSEKGKNIKALFKMKNFAPIPAIYIKNIKEFYVEYLKLKKLYR